MINYSFPIFSAVEMNDTDPLASKPAWIGTAQGVAIQATWTGDATGAFKLQASCSSKKPNSLDANADPGIPEDSWCDLPDSDFAVTEAGSYIWNYDGAYFPWVRVYYTPTDGSGTLDGVANIKSDEVLG